MKNPSYSHWNAKDGWWKSDTEIFVNKVITKLTPSDLTPSFLLSYDSIHFNLFLPLDIQLLLLVSYLNRTADVISFARTSKSNYTLFYRNAAESLLRPLLDHVAFAEFDKAEKIYCKHPTVLTMRGTTSYCPHRYYYVNHTSFQILLRNAEYKKAEEYGQYLSPEERQKQFNEIFPDGELKSYGCQLETAKALLHDVYNAIIMDDVIHENNLDQMTDKTRSVLKLLEDAVNPENYHEYQIGLVFDVQIYLEALGLYDTNFHAFGNWHRRTFWRVKVEELIASCLPTVYLRAHCQGIGNVLNGNVVNWDKLSAPGCMLSDGSSYFHRDPNDRPGVHFFVGYYGAARHEDEKREARWAILSGGHLFQNLCQATTRTGTDFMQQYFHANTSTCLTR